MPCQIQVTDFSDVKEQSEAHITIYYCNTLFISIGFESAQIIYFFNPYKWHYVIQSIKLLYREKKECHRTAIDILQDYYYRILNTNFPNELTRHKLLNSLLLVYSGK